MKKRQRVVVVGPEIGFKRTRFLVSYIIANGGDPILEKVIRSTTPFPDKGITEHPRFIVSIKSALQGAVSKKESDAI
jgi:hypothetical protein